MVKVAVVGGGSAGAVVAARLADAALEEVVLIEAGPDYGPLADGRWPAEFLDAGALATSHDWGYQSGPQPGREPWTWERARIMGGCSAHNGAIAAVGHRDDYDAWGLPSWRTDVLRPLFDRVLEKMRVRAYSEEEAGPFHAACLQAATAEGWNIASDLCNLDANTSFGLETVNVVDGLRWNTAFAYLDPVRHHPNLDIVDRTMVDKIEVGANGGRISGQRNGAPVTIDADLVILAAGVYGTPAILQRSGIGDPSRLRDVGIKPISELPSVGQNLHDHPMISAGRELGPEIRQWLSDAAEHGFVPEEQTLGKAASSLSGGIFDLHLFPVCASTQTVLTGGRALVEVACVTPKSRGSMHVAGADPEAHPVIDHGYLSDPDGHDLAVLREGLVMAEELLEQPALREILIGEPARDLSDEAIRRDVQHYYHPVGTACMGRDSETSVCDERGRVHGEPSLVIADASIMPTIPRANTNVPTIVIGERIADLLLQDL